MPTLGQPVLYQRPAGHRPKGLVAGLVTRINDDDTVHLVVFEPGTPAEHVESVPTALVSTAL